jgi:TIR domain
MLSSCARDADRMRCAVATPKVMLGGDFWSLIGEQPERRHGAMAWRVFYSYSHEDAEIRDKLGTCLAPLKHQDKIVEWHDRKIAPGAEWHAEISAQLDSAHLILLLISADFLASEYCFGVEVERALARLKRNEVKVVPVLLRPCLWEDSRFSQLQIIPRDARPLTSFSSLDEALKAVAEEIKSIVAGAPPTPSSQFAQDDKPHALDLVRGQVRSYANLYEKTRQRMPPSPERTRRMEQIFQQMRALATASYPLLGDLTASPRPGERLAAVSILQVFATASFLPFLVRLVGSEKPFVGYHAAKALHFAVESLDPRLHEQLLETIHAAQRALASAEVGFDSDRATMLRLAEEELKRTMSHLASARPAYD